MPAMSPIFAHAGGIGLAASAWRHWPWEPVTLVLLIGSAALYARGVATLWRRAGAGAGIARWQAAAFGLGLVTLAAALVSPLAWLSEVLFSAHMTQHEILMLVSAPLLVFGMPLQAFLWNLRSQRREAIGRWTRTRSVNWTWRVLTGPAAAFLLHGLALWIWHAPPLYEAALASAAVHALQHASFLFTAALFWWGMVHGRYGRIGYGVAVVYVFLTAVHSSILGALMTIAPSLWYPSYDTAAASWQIDPLVDQQLAGLLMWVPSGIVFIVFGLALLAAWLGESERRASLGSVTQIAIVVLATTALVSCSSAGVDAARALTGGEPSRGKDAIGRYGCGGCHEIPGVRGADGLVGPPLARVARRTYLGGHVPNTPADMMRWIQHPQAIEAGTAMPDMHVSEQDARDITAYLYTLR